VVTTMAEILAGLAWAITAWLAAALPAWAG
jgi:hypothetical protein